MGILNMLSGDDTNLESQATATQTFSFDELGGSAILRRARIPRVDFDPTNSDHRESLKVFLDTGNWGKIHFYSEFPCVSVPETVLKKMCSFAIEQLKQ